MLLRLSTAHSPRSLASAGGRARSNPWPRPTSRREQGVRLADRAARRARRRSQPGCFRRRWPRLARPRPILGASPVGRFGRRHRTADRSWPLGTACRSRYLSDCAGGDLRSDDLVNASGRSGRRRAVVCCSSATSRPWTSPSSNWYPTTATSSATGRRREHSPATRPPYSTSTAACFLAAHAIAGPPARGGRRRRRRQWCSGYVEAPHSAPPPSVSSPPARSSWRPPAAGSSCPTRPIPGRTPGQNRPGHRCLPVRVFDATPILGESTWRRCTTPKHGSSNTTRGEPALSDEFTQIG